MSNWENLLENVDICKDQEWVSKSAIVIDQLSKLLDNVKVFDKGYIKWIYNKIVNKKIIVKKDYENFKKFWYDDATINSFKTWKKLLEKISFNTNWPLSIDALHNMESSLANLFLDEKWSLTIDKFKDYMDDLVGNYWYVLDYDWVWNLNSDNTIKVAVWEQYWLVKIQEADNKIQVTNILLNNIYDDIWEFDEFGYAQVIKNDKKWIIHKDANWIITFLIECNYNKLMISSDWYVIGRAEKDDLYRISWSEVVKISIWKYLRIENIWTWKFNIYDGKYWIATLSETWELQELVPCISTSPIMIVFGNLWYIDGLQWKKLIKIWLDWKFEILDLAYFREIYCWFKYHIDNSLISAYNYSWWFSVLNYSLIDWIVKELSFDWNVSINEISDRLEWLFVVDVWGKKWLFHINNWLVTTLLSFKYSHITWFNKDGYAEVKIGSKRWVIKKYSDWTVKEVIAVKYDFNKIPVIKVDKSSWKDYYRWFFGRKKFID